MSERTLKETLARYMDPDAFVPVPESAKHTCKTVGKSLHDRQRARRAVAMKRAECAIRFFSKADNRLWLDHRAAALAPAARQGGDAQQAPAESPQSGPPQEGNAQ